MKILVNKTFNTAYFAEYLNTTMKPNSKVFTSGEFKIYNSATTATTVVNGSFTQVMFVPKSYLDLIDTLNTAAYNNTLDLGAGYALDLVINTLYASNRTERNLMVDYLLGKGYCTANQASQIKTLVSSLSGFVPANMTFEYNSLEDIYSYSYGTPFELSQPYSKTNNVGESGSAEKMYLVAFTQISVNYGDVAAVNSGTGVYSPVHRFYIPVLDTSVPQASYIATELGDINDDTADLKYDHMDVIDYIDSFRFRFKLPRVIA